MVLFLIAVGAEKKMYAKKYVNKVGMIYNDKGKFIKPHPGIISHWFATAV